MKKKVILVDYWDKKIEIPVPESTAIGEIKDPASLQQPEQAVRQAIANPIAAEPLSELARKARNGKVTIAFDDPGRPPWPRRLIIPILLEVLLKAGVKLENIYLLTGNGNHCKYSPSQMRDFLGSDIYDQFCPLGSASRVLNHDCHDPDNLVYMGVSEMGDYVEYNKLLLESDLFIYSGTFVPTNWGGISGTGVVIGLPSSRSMISTHSAPVTCHPDSCHGDPRTSLFRAHKQSIMKQIEKFIGKRVFYVDVALGAGGNIANVFAGSSPEINETAWEFVESKQRVEVPQADVLIIGTPRSPFYGESNNPLISLVAACAPTRMGVGKPMIRDGGVIINLTVCDGTINEQVHPSYPEIINIYRKCLSIDEMVAYENEFLHREDLISKYRYGYAFAPIHGFWLFYESQYALERANKIIFAGIAGPGNSASNPWERVPGGPGAARDVGCVPARDFDHAWDMAEKIVGKNPVVLALPTFHSRIRPQFFVK